MVSKFVGALAAIAVMLFWIFTIIVLVAVTVFVLIGLEEVSHVTYFVLGVLS